MRSTLGPSYISWGAPAGHNLGVNTGRFRTSLLAFLKIHFPPYTPPFEKNVWWMAVVGDNEQNAPVPQAVARRVQLDELAHTIVIGTAVLGILSVIFRGLQGLLDHPLGGGGK
ncbi:hypothetical protein FB451DRAFT_1164411 [Mycena latifolia]|nr:hypothetical protein FB451DRAFT_1164411 [Mycena latifolia]